MSEFSVVVPGRPVPKSRPRVTAAGTYTEAQVVQHEQTIGWLAQAKLRGQWDKDGWYAVSAEFVGPHPSADVDNLLKTVLDGLNGIAWHDDRQVVELRKVRIVPLPKGQGRLTRVTVTRVEDGR